MADAPLGALAKIPLFARVPKRHLRTILKQMSEYSYEDGVTILAPLNLPSEMATHASQLYAKNVENLLGLLISEGKLSLDFEDEIVAGACLTHGGEIKNERAREAAGAAA